VHFLLFELGAGVIKAVKEREPSVGMSTRLTLTAQLVEATRASLAQDLA